MPGGVNRTGMTARIPLAGTHLRRLSARRFGAAVLL